ncbi:MAG: efflux transporter outer membrane subunit [Steroidobacteraceae bacterium]
MGNSSLLRLGAVLLAPLVLGGCIVSHVSVDKPELALPEALATVTQAVPLTDRWWSVYGDPTLDRLMEEALVHNADAALAAARVLESRSALRQANSNRSPAVSIEGNAARRFESVLAGQSPDPGVARDSFSAQGVVTYELDLWGRYTRASEAARARLLASEFDRDAVRLSLTGDVARGYFSLLAAQQQLDRARETLAARRESVGLEKVRHEAGESDEATLRRTEAEASASAISAQQFELEFAQRTHALGVLLGRSPKELMEASFTGVLPSSPVLSPGLPSTVLERRPDVRSAEAALAAAAADIGVARTGLFPSISLTGTYGSASQELADLFTSPAKQWSLAAGLLQPVFQAGRLRAAVERANALQQQRQAEYARTVQNAFRDVLDALKGQELLGGIRQTTADQAAALARAAELSELRYSAGEIAYLDLLDVRRNLYQSQIALVGAQRDALTNSVSLALALGGGSAP